MIEQLLLDITNRIVSRLYGENIPVLNLPVEKTKKEINGDYTVVIFSVTRYSHKAPETTAAEIGNEMMKEIPGLASFNVIKGFLNLCFSDNYWISFMLKEAGNDQYGFAPQRQEDPVLVEYSSPNTNKPLHLGHIRNNLLGFSLAEILKANGYPVIRMNLVNDRGIHICKSMLAYMKWGKGETPESTGIKPDHLIGKYYVLFEKHYREEVKKLVEEGTSEEEALRSAPLIREAQDILRKWEARDPETRALWALMNDWAYKGFETTYTRLGVAFDIVQHESDTYLLGKKVVTDGLEQGVLSQKDDGSIWIDLTQDGLDEKLLLRGDGTSVYMTQDLGTAVVRYDKFHPTKMIYVVGNEQNYHFDVLRRTLKKLGRDWSERIYHLSYGMVELPNGKMKSREGTVVDADDLMDEMFSTAEQTTRELGKANELPATDAQDLFRMIGLGALKYFILKVDPKKNMLFDPAESIDFNGNTGPFIQYTHARVRSLLKRAETQTGFSESTALQELKDQSGIPVLPLEKEIIKKLFIFPSIVKEAGETFSPALIANYLFDLSKEYNQFYQEVPVLKEENVSCRDMRLILSVFTGKVIKKGMRLLGIDVPERM
ncbi:MAG: arginine--tRNA ligase [Bacteroidota bacterium]|nr:arginine--tRNA ligase [Bacteroidota bacterium]